MSHVDFLAEAPFVRDTFRILALFFRSSNAFWWKRIYNLSILSSIDLSIPLFYMTNYYKLWNTKWNFDNKKISKWNLQYDKLMCLAFSVRI